MISIKSSNSCHIYPTHHIQSKLYSLGSLSDAGQLFPCTDASPIYRYSASLSPLCFQFFFPTRKHSSIQLVNGCRVGICKMPLWCGCLVVAHPPPHTLYLGRAAVTAFLDTLDSRLIKVAQRFDGACFCKGYIYCIMMIKLYFGF